MPHHPLPDRIADLGDDEGRGDEVVVVFAQLRGTVGACFGQHPFCCHARIDDKRHRVSRSWRIMSVESPDTLPIFLRIASAAAHPSSLVGRRPSLIISRTVSLTEVPFALAFSFRRRAVSSSRLRTRMSVMAGLRE